MDWHELLEYKVWKHPNEKFCRKNEIIQTGRVQMVLEYPIILVCTLCKLSKICSSKPFHVHDSF